MKKQVCGAMVMVIVAVSLLSARPALADEPQQNVPPQGFTALFNGKDLTGWWGLPHFDPHKLQAMTADEREELKQKHDQAFRKHWRVENGELVNDGNGPFATTDADYGDFELWVEYKTVPNADSGIYLRGVPQVQIWDTTEAGGKWKHGADKGSGGLWNNQKHPNAPLVHADKPFGEWNSLRITMLGNNVTVYLNDQLVVDNVPLENYWHRDQPLPKTGPIQLQTHGGEIRWRNVFLREIKSGEGKLQ